jgi:hypothetical protein
MSQGTQGLDIQNVSGANYRQYVNEALKQVATMSSGPTAPSNPQQQQLWFDTNRNIVKMYYGSSWITVLAPGTNDPAGLNNVGLGNNLFSQISNGYRNVVIGNGGYLISTGYRNTVIGVDAFTATTGGYANTVIGSLALASNITGANNTAIGFAAGTSGYGIDITTENNHVILGNSSVQKLICTVDRTGHSDARYKKDIEVLNFSGLAYINALIPRKFTWNMRKCIGSKKDITEIGFIAQEVESVQSSVYAVPGIVSTYDVDYTDPETNEHVVTDQKLITPGTLIPILVKAIQELTVRVELLETALQAQ